MTEFIMAMDIGGTFLDTVVIDAAGTTTTAKVLSTHDDYSRCISEAVREVAAKLDLSEQAFLSRCRLAINGTTVATNVLAELRGPKVGLVTTAGTADTLYMARIHRWGTLDPLQLRPLPQIVPRERILEVDERIDAQGQVVFPLDPEALRRSLRAFLRSHDVQAMAVCLLWSFANPAHERAIREAILELAPDMPVSISSEVFPAIREYERTNTTVIDAFISPGVRRYVDDLQRYFREAGFEGALRMVHAAGGVATPDEIKRYPVTLINSGPVAGYVGAMKFGAMIGRANIITADVGGTSFDAGVIVDGKVTLRHRTMVPAPGHPSPGYLTGLSLMDVVAIGAGGGSIGWVDPRGVIRVGPQSAGSRPGPVAFGRGGEEPTLTDACLILGLLGADAFMGGSFELDLEGARQALETRLAQPTGLASAEEAAAAVYKLACIEMANNVRRVTIEKGHDPRDFSLFCYGGAGGLFLAPVCVAAAVPEMIAPENCAVFSAFGALMSDYRRTGLRACPWRAGEDPAVVRDRVEELTRTLTAESLEAGFAADAIVVEREADMRFVGQAAELAAPLPDGPIGPDFADKMVANFKAAYARVFGAESIWLNATPEIVNVRVTVSAPNVAYRPTPVVSTGGGVPQPRTHRPVFWPFTMQQSDWPVYRRADLPAGLAMDGPLIVESAETTIVAPPDAAMTVDTFGNIVVKLANPAGTSHA